MFFGWGVFRLRTDRGGGGGCARGKKAGSGSQTVEEEEATGSNSEDRQSGRRRECRRDPDADGEGPIAGKEGGQDIEEEGIVGSE